MSRAASHDVVVAGGGFAGLYAAWRLARDGASVALVEADAGLGGNLRSRVWRNYRLDHGTHYLDLGLAPSRAFYADVLGDELRVLDEPCRASTLGARWTTGFERQDWAAERPTVAARALDELRALERSEACASRADAPHAGASTDGLDTDTTGYLDWYRATHGETLADAIGPMVRKVTGSEADGLSADARGALDMFSRPKLGDDASMVELKASGRFWDARAGVTLDCGDVRFTGTDVRGRFAYPDRGGLLRLCERAEARLNDLGVDVVAGAPIDRVRDSADGVTVGAGSRTVTGASLLWTLPEFLLARLLDVPERMRELAVPVGTAFFAFEVPEAAIAGPDYLVDYAAHRLPLRYNRLGAYGRQTGADGYTPVVAEVACHPADLAATAVAGNAAAAWAALLDTGFLRPGTRFRGSTFWGHPVAYSLPRPGARDAQDALLGELARRVPRARCIGAGRRGRDAFVRHYEAELHPSLAGSGQHENRGRMADPSRVAGMPR